MQHCIGVVGTVIETGAYIVVLIVGAKNNEREMEVGSLVAVLATIEMLFSSPLCGRFINDDTSCSRFGK